MTKQVVHNYVYFDAADSFHIESYHPIDIFGINFPSIKHFLFFAWLQYTAEPSVAEQVPDMSLDEIDRFEGIFPLDETDQMYKIIEEQAVILATWLKFRTYPELITELEFYEGYYFRGPNRGDLAAAQAIRTITPYLRGAGAPEFIPTMEYNIRQVLQLPHISADN